MRAILCKYTKHLSLCLPFSCGFSCWILSLSLLSSFAFFTSPSLSILLFSPRYFLPPPPLPLRLPQIPGGSPRGPSGPAGPRYGALLLLVAPAGSPGFSAGAARGVAAARVPRSSGRLRCAYTLRPVSHHFVSPATSLQWFSRQHTNTRPHTSQHAFVCCVGILLKCKG